MMTFVLAASALGALAVGTRPAYMRPAGPRIGRVRALCLGTDVDEPLPEAAGSPSQPVGVHLGVVCDRTLNPIVGYRYTRAGSRPSYDLCQAEYDKLSPEEQRSFERLAPTFTPRRAAIALSVMAAVAAALRFAPTAGSPTGTGASYDYDDFLELPPLSPAEELVGAIFRPRVPATEREVAPTAPRRPALRSAARGGVSPAAAADRDACDEACKQRIADRRALFEQSRTTSDRQTIINLSKQRAKLYNTTFQGVECIPGLPCL